MGLGESISSHPSSLPDLLPHDLQTHYLLGHQDEIQLETKDSILLSALHCQQGSYSSTTIPQSFPIEIGS